MPHDVHGLPGAPYTEGTGQGPGFVAISAPTWLPPGSARPRPVAPACATNPPKSRTISSLERRDGPPLPAVSAQPDLETEMAVPRKKVSPMKKGQRQSHDALVAPAYVEDKDSGERRRPHHIDLKTGKYRGRQILAPKSDA